MTKRAAFCRLVETPPDTLIASERAAWLLYLLRTGFTGRVSGRHFGVTIDRPARFNLTTLEPMLEDLHSRLAGVGLACLDCEAFIRCYDSPGTLFHLAPLLGVGTGNGKAPFNRAGFQHLSNTLRGTRTSSYCRSTTSPRCATSSAVAGSRRSRPLTPWRQNPPLTQRKNC